MPLIANPFVQLILLALVLWLVYYVIGELGVPARPRQIIGWVFAALIVIDAVLLVLGNGWVPYRERVAAAPDSQQEYRAQFTPQYEPPVEPQRKFRAQLRT